VTGGRKSEVLGLTVDDVSLERRTVTFRPNKYRGLKTRSSRRTVPLWPQLEEVLREHLEERRELSIGLLFPSPASNGREQMITDLRR
jgi:integrase